MLQTHNAGRSAEQYVVNVLKSKGFFILRTNYRVFSGEIDIIARDTQNLLFVEVKYRTSPTMAIECLISKKKQQRLIGAALRFMAEYPASNRLTCRFDVAILVTRQGKSEFTYFENAFNVSDNF